MLLQYIDCARTTRLNVFVRWDEASELLELTQRTSEAGFENESRNEALRRRLAEECSDVLLYLHLIAERLEIEFQIAAAEKFWTIWHHAKGSILHTIAYIRALEIGEISITTAENQRATPSKELEKLSDTGD